MKRITIINISLLLLIILSGNIPFIAIAQKLPKMQKTGLRAPVDIKIDGKTTEWNDKFQAYNVNNRIYYTISNNEDNLYLTICAADGYANEKAIFGISFIVIAEKGNKSKENVVVTYPITIAAKKMNHFRYTIGTVRDLQNDITIKGEKKIDSIRLFANKWMDESFKEINVAGIKAVRESPISIYNREGIKVAVQFNDQMRYTYEMAIPLKYLGSSINNGQKFKYTIKMNGLPDKTPDSPYSPPTVPSNFTDPSPEAQGSVYISYSTDLSGVYTLVKK